MKSSATSRLNVIIPLYIYPDPGAWYALHRSIQNRPDICFTAIVNPGSGPGPAPLPDSNYLFEIPKLRAYPNVTLLGYVHISYANRPLAEVKRDVETYSLWADHHADHPGLAVDGIFVDETPYEVGETAKEYLSQLTRFTKSRSGLGADRTIVYNPGCVPALASLEFADMTIIFEDSYDVFKSRLSSGLLDLHRMFSIAADQEYPFDRSRFGIMIHSIPTAVEDAEIQQVLRQAKGLAESIFVTEATTQFYEKFSEKWSVWVAQLAVDEGQSASNLNLSK